MFDYLRKIFGITPKPPTRKAVLALIYDSHNDHFLMTTRDSWRVGFIGGKLEPGENFMEALIREVREEANLTILEEDIDTEMLFEDFRESPEGDMVVSLYVVNVKSFANMRPEPGKQLKWMTYEEVCKESEFPHYNEEALVEFYIQKDLW